MLAIAFRAHIPGVAWIAHACGLVGVAHAVTAAIIGARHLRAVCADKAWIASAHARDRRIDGAHSACPMSRALVRTVFRFATRAREAVIADTPIVDAGAAPVRGTAVVLASELVARLADEPLVAHALSNNVVAGSVTPAGRVLAGLLRDIAHSSCPASGADAA
jgi:hypothetical protein